MRMVVVALVLALGAPLAAAPPGQQEIEESLTCQCGCGLTVHSCNHIQCGSGEPIKKEIAERLARGETKEQILGAFTQKFGEKVLSSPTFQGFNRFAWITPFAALLIAGTILAVVVRKRSRAVDAALAPAPAASCPPASDALRARLARELADLERES
jgi:cytochrome c-type biogenesis protein CcmH